MALRTIRETGLPPTAYYAPGYKVVVEGQEVAPDVKGDVLDMKVSMDMDNMTSFEFTVSNWDDESLSFKYSDTDLFNVGNRLQVQMGYTDRMVSMVVGQITNLAPKFPDNGTPVMNITGLDGMLKLRDRKPLPNDTKKFENMADWQIAQIIAQRNNLDTYLTREGETHPLVIQRAAQDDATFLKERAARSDRDVFVLTDPDTGNDTLYFVKPLDGRTADRTRVFVFEWGKSLMSFNPTLKLDRQVGKVTVHGWDPQTKQAIVYTADPKDLPGSSGGGKSGPEVAGEALKGKEEVVVDAPVSSDQEAKDLAISLLTERAYEFITGQGQVIGLPDLRPGDNVELANLGKRFSGTYYVKKVDHTFNQNGYLTSFEVRKLYDGGVA